MRAMILAAGRGKRMGTLTDDTPKALLKIEGRYLIEYSIYALVAAGIKEVVINVCYLKDQIKQSLGNGARFGITILYSEEEIALETGGGIFQALPLLGPEPFIVLSCDIISAYPLNLLPKEPQGLAHLVMVNNPFYHPKGDFCLTNHKIHYGTHDTFTFGNIGVYRPELFSTSTQGCFPLSQVLKPAILNDQVSGELFTGMWHNVGTPLDLGQVNCTRYLTD